MSESIERRIEQVINKLLHETAFDGKWLGTGVANSFHNGKWFYTTPQGDAAMQGLLKVWVL
jgi:hypothetical protein